MSAADASGERVAPSGLGNRGRALWLAVVDLCDLTVAEDELLLEACRTADDAERLAAALADAPLTVEGSVGQPRANPLAKDLRDTRQLLARLLAQLEVPHADGDAEVGGWDGLSSSQRARKAAHARWKRGG